MLVANIFKPLSRFMAILGLTLLTLPTASAWTMFGQPQNEQECLLQNLKGVNDTFVAQMIAVACGELFASKKNAAECVQRELTPLEIQKLQWSAADITQRTSGPYFSAKFYNGTKDTAITAVTLEIFETGPDPQEGFKVVPYVGKLEDIVPLDFKPQEYKMWLDGPIAPKEVGKVTKTILKTPPKDWSWNVTSVIACQ